MNEFKESSTSMESMDAEINVTIPVELARQISKVLYQSESKEGLLFHSDLLACAQKADAEGTVAIFWGKSRVKEVVAEANKSLEKMRRSQHRPLSTDEACKLTESVRQLERCLPRDIALYGCHNRKPLVENVSIGKGYDLDGNWTSFSYPNVMSKDCRYSIHNLDERCQGCIHQQFQNA